MSTPKEKSIIDKERKQVKAFLTAIRQENEAIGENLASMVSLIASLRKNYLGIKLTLDVFEERLGNK